MRGVRGVFGMAIKKMLVLSGVANAGKTWTLNLLAEKIHKMGHRLLSSSKMPPPVPGWRKKDHWYVFEVVKASKKTIVGISTQGDNAAVITKAVNYFSQFSPHVDVIILASRSCYSKSVEAIEKWKGLGRVIPDYTALMHKQKASYSNRVQSAIVDRFYNKI